MEITSSSLIDLSRLLGEWIVGIANKLGAKKREYIDTLSSVNNALTITRSYVAHLNRGNQEIMIRRRLYPYFGIAHQKV